MKYRVTITSSISPTDDSMSYNVLSFTRSYEIEAEDFQSAGRKIDFLYEQVEKVGNNS